MAIILCIYIHDGLDAGTVADESATVEYTLAVRVIGGRLSVAEMHAREEVRTEMRNGAIERPEGHIRRVLDRSDYVSILYKRTKSRV